MAENTVIDRQTDRQTDLDRRTHKPRTMRTPRCAEYTLDDNPDLNFMCHGDTVELRTKKCSRRSSMRGYRAIVKDIVLALNDTY